MPRLIFTVNEQMEEDLKAVADKQGATLSNLIRILVAQGLAPLTGKDVEDYTVKVGGYRERVSDSGESEP